MKTFKLNNGIKVFFDKQKTNKTSIIINFNVGSLWENSKEKGIAHLVEHLMFKETDKHNTKELLEKLELNGANINACTSYDYTRFYFTSLTEHFEEVLQLYVEMLTSKNISEEEFLKEKRVVIQELQMDSDDDFMCCYNNLMKNMFNMDPVVGFEEVLKEITLEDIYNWINKYFVIENMNISIISNMKDSELKDMLNKHFSSFKHSENPKIFKSDLKRLVKNNNVSINEKYVKIAEDNNQVNIILYYPLFTNIDINNYISYSVLRDILNKGLTSVLFREIREKFGFCYRIKAYLESLANKYLADNKNNYGILIHTSCAPEFVDRCIEEIDKVMNNLSNIITENDIIKVNNIIKTKEKEQIDQLEDIINIYMQTNTLVNLEYYNKLYNTVTLDNIVKLVSSETFTKKNISIYGPYKEN